MMTTKKDGSRYSYWAPAAFCSAIDGTNTILTCDDHKFSGNETGNPRDVEWFDTDKAGSSPIVTIYPSGDYASRVTRTVSAVTLGAPDASTITITAAAALTPPLVVEFADYDNASLEANQRRYAYQSDGDHKLDKSAGSDLPYKYN
jgi:hypothetical protein